MTDTPRLLTMTAEQWATEEREMQYLLTLALRSEVRAQAARVQALEQTIEVLSNGVEAKALLAGIEDLKAGRFTPLEQIRREDIALVRPLKARITELEQERERIRQALVTCRNYFTLELAPDYRWTAKVVGQELDTLIARSLAPAGEREETTK